MKVQEIDNIIKEEVTPKLEQLKRDKNNFDSYKSNVGELERSEKILVAFKFFELYKIAEDPEGRGNELIA